MKVSKKGKLVKKKKRKLSASTAAVDINVMPFIDVFSLLCTFLLFSSVFITIGIHTVQVPFFSNAITTDENEKPKREHILLLEVSTKNLKLTSQWSQAPIAKEVHSFSNSTSGLEKLHKKLVEIKEKNIDSKKIKLFFDDKVAYESVTNVLDSVIEINSKEKVSPKLANLGKLFPQVVLGNVLF